uniref:Uncharacterized protein n=1 Tax=Acrobeloides nanus TaxID=290746 RepID=A0A914E608_9BILA
MNFLNLFIATTDIGDVTQVQLSTFNISTDLKHHHEEETDLATRGSSKKLTEFLLSQHNKNAPPDGIVDVYYELELVHILGIDELKQTMTALVYIDERWTDPTLSWEPSEHGNIEKTWLPMHEVWMPDIIIFNMLHHEDLLSRVRAPIMLYSNGTVECSHPAVYTVTCQINIRHFPLDDQRCALEIASWAYSDEKIRLHAHIEHSLEHYAPNEEWRLLNVSIAEKEYEHEGIAVSEIHYEIAVRRKPLFYMVTLTFPSYVMCAISIVGLFARFSTTGEREERFTLGVTAILTMAVLSLVVSEKVPHSSTHIPLLVAYFLFNMVVVSAAAMTTGIVMRVHRRGRFGEEPPTWLLRLFILSAKSQVKKPYTNNRSNPSPTHQGILPSKNYTNNDPNHTFSFDWTDDILRQKNIPPNVDSALFRKICMLETFMGKLADIWQGMQVDGMRDHFIEHQVNREINGYVRISERLDWILMIFFLVLVTGPVAYLFLSM